MKQYIVYEIKVENDWNGGEVTSKILLVTENKNKALKKQKVNEKIRIVEVEKELDVEVYICDEIIGGGTSE